METVYACFQIFIPGHAFFITSDRRIALCLPSALAGDHIVVALGCTLALVLNPMSEHAGHIQMRGGCYIHGLMNGRASTDHRIRASMGSALGQNRTCRNHRDAYLFRWCNMHTTRSSTWPASIRLRSLLRRRGISAILRLRGRMRGRIS